MQRHVREDGTALFVGRDACFIVAIDVTARERANGALQGSKQMPDARRATVIWSTWVVGVTLKAPFKGRDNDVVGLAVGYAKIGSHAQDRQRHGLPTTPGYPSRSSDTIIEATYQYQATPSWRRNCGDAQIVMRTVGIRGHAAL
mgnify:CR=1 FL=1